MAARLPRFAEQARPFAREAAAERDPGHPMTPGSRDQTGQTLGRIGNRQPLWADVGEAVARRVDGPGRRLPGQVDAERVGGAEPRTFADQHSGEIGAEDAADLIADRDAAAGHDRDRANAERAPEP